MRALSNELFGVSLTLPDFPRVRSLRGLGISDSDAYAAQLREKLDYRNTFHDREPRFDLTNPPPGEAQLYDFIIASEVFEHVLPPVGRAFENTLRLLKPNGVLLMTVPYSLEPATAEHFPDLAEFGLAKVGDATVLVSRSSTGEFEATDRTAFHIGCQGPAPELREFSEAGLREELTKAGLSRVRIYSEDYEEFGIVPEDAWSLPIAARPGPAYLDTAVARDIVENWRGANDALKRIGARWWFRLGRKLGVCG